MAVTLSKVKYIDITGEEQTITDYTLVTSSESAVTWDAGYYVVGYDYNGDGEINADDAALGQKSFTISNQVLVNGNVKLILADGFSLSVDTTALEDKDSAAINVHNSSKTATDNQFFVYGQASGTGVLNVESKNGAGIGGDSNQLGNNITIVGGVVNANSITGAGIGGGKEGSGSNITIAGGVVNASADSGAGIGGGNQGEADNITISGGVVNASAVSGAAIGSGNESNDQGGAQNITISGGVVNASADSGAGIGGGKESSSSNITISGGVVNASSGSGAGIGGGESKGGDNILIKGGVVNANSNTGAGIGGGEADCAGTIEISSGIVSAVSTAADAIGCGYCGGGSGGVYVNVDLTVRGGTSAGEWVYVSKADDHTEDDDLTDDLAGNHYASVCILSDGSEYDNSAHYDGVSTRVEGFTGGEARMLIGGEVVTDAASDIKPYAISIGSGTFDNSVACGSAAKGANITQNGGISLTIDGGTFAKRVAGGMYVANDTGFVTLDGDANLTIKGGTFNGRIYAGCNAQQDSLGANSTIIGNVNTQIDSSENAIHIGNYLIGGSRGAGIVTGSVTVTFTGLGKNLTFGESSIVSGGSNADIVKIKEDGKREIVSAVEGSRNLVFDNFTGDFGAELKLFSTATFKNNSEVAFTAEKNNPWSVETWNFEAGSSFSGLRANDFENDTLNFDVTGLTEDWTVGTGTVAAFNDLDLASAVYFGSSKADYSSETSCWTDGTYQLSLNDTKTAMIVSKLA